MPAKNIEIFRADSRFTVGPFHSLFQEGMDLWGSRTCFTLKKSRMLNPFFYSKSSLKNEILELEIVSKFRTVVMRSKVESIGVPSISPPLLFPFFSVGTFKVSLEEGRSHLTIGRELDKNGEMYGKVIFADHDYRYLYKFTRYRGIGLAKLFPDGLPSCWSMNSIAIISFLVIWLNAYNADYRNS